MRAKGVFMRDLEQLRAKKQASQQAAAPPAPMVIDLDGLQPTGPAVPVAPMMATGGSPFVANRGLPNAEGKPVAPFPDMGMGMGAPNPKPVATVPFARVKPPAAVDQKRPSPKQPTPKQTPKQIPKPAPKTTPKAAPKSSPPSGRMGNKPNPMANAPPNQAPKPTASAPPAGSAIASAPMPAAAPPASMLVPPPAAPVAPVAPAAAQQAPPAPTSNVPGPQNSFTNATFTIADPATNDQSGSGDMDMGMPVFDMENFGTGGPEDPASGHDDVNDTTMGDLDHFFELSGDPNTNIDDSSFNMDSYMDTEFTNFDSFN